MFNSVVDANVNRVSEGLRVIEEYLRFVRSHKDFTLRIASIRKQLNSSFKQSAKHLVARFGGNDVRAKEVPVKRRDVCEVLIANFKRVEEDWKKR